MTTLPKISQPIFEETIPSTGQKISMRPWLVKEERILLIAKQSGDAADITQAVIQCLNNCILDKVDINKLTPFDVDWLFLKVKAKAVGDKTDVEFVCNNTPEGQTDPCGSNFKVTIDMKNVKMNGKVITKFDEGPFTDKLNIQRIYPTFKETSKSYDNEGDFDRTTRMIIASIDWIASKDKNSTPIKLADLKPEETAEFINSLTTTQLKTLETFLDEMPTYYLDTTNKCPKCGFEHKLHFENLLSFFP